MKMGMPSFIVGIIALIAGTAATFMGYSAGFSIGLIFFGMGFIAYIFEHEVIDCLLLTFVGVAGLVFTLNFAQTHLGGGHASHEASPHEGSAEPAAAGEHH